MTEPYKLDESVNGKDLPTPLKLDFYHDLFTKYHTVGENNGDNPEHNLCPYIGKAEDSNGKEYIATNCRHRSGIQDDPTNQATHVQKEFIERLKNNPVLEFIPVRGVKKNMIKLGSIYPCRMKDWIYKRFRKTFMLRSISWEYC